MKTSTPDFTKLAYDSFVFVPTTVAMPEAPAMADDWLT